jgi:small subunit ribosomal protein S2
LGHPTCYWNPKIKVYTYGVKNGTHLIDLVKTRKQLKTAKKFLREVGRNKKEILFVGTKDQAEQAVEERAKASQSFFVTERWLGGILTNWSTIQASLLQLSRLEREEKNGSWISLSKKDVSRLRKRLIRLDRYFRGLKGMRIVPDVVIIVGQTVELVAVLECRKLKIPIISRLDTDCNPDLVDIGVPINDDSTERIILFLENILFRIKTGRQNLISWLLKY